MFRQTLTIPDTSTSVDWGAWQNGSNVFRTFSTTSESIWHQNAYWFIADVSTATIPSTSGTWTFDNVLGFQGEYNHTTDNGSGTSTSAPISAVDQFEFDLDFSSGVISSGSLSLTSGNYRWLGSELNGSLDGAFISLNITDGLIEDITIPLDPDPLNGIVTGLAKGYFVGASAIDGAVIGFTLKNDTDSANVDHVLVGNVLLGPGTPPPEPFTLPEPTIETHNISWGSWDNPIEDNWVIVNDSGLWKY